MRNQQAARYARWAAIAAGIIALAVAGVYAQRAIRVARVRHSAPPTLPASVQQQSADFTYTDSDAQGRTIFTVRASHATQFKDQNRDLLEDVWITIYGRQGNRNDNIHTDECSYQLQSGDFRCEGDVQIDLQAAGPAAGKPAEKALEVRTSNLSFNRNSGEASTAAPVQFDFSGGQGRGVGVTYSSNDSTVRVEHEIQFELAASDRTDGLPVSATGSSLTVGRNDRVVVLEGPAEVRQGDRVLSAGKISIGLDESYHAQRVLVEGDPEVHATEEKAKFSVAAEQFEVLLGPEGWAQRIVADGKVTGRRQTSTGTDRFMAAHAEFRMLPDHNLLQDMTASGTVTGSSQQGKDSRVLATESLHVTFAGGSAQSAQKQRIKTAESLAPATIRSSSGEESTELRAQRIVAEFDANGRMDKLLGHSGVEVRRQTGTAAPQISSASELAATFGKGGEWDSLDESGNVRFGQADRHANAAHARISDATGAIELEGGAEFSDSISRTTAATVTIDQKSGEIHATGGVVSTYVPTQQGSAVSFGVGSAHISAEEVSGSSASGNLVYVGNARFWQGDSVLEASQIQIWRDEKKMEATGHVVAAVPQASGSPDEPFRRQPVAPGKAASGPILWTVRAPALTYWDGEGKAHLEGGVSASSSEGSLTARSLDVFLSPAGASTEAVVGARSASAGRQLGRILAQGNAVVRQGERRAVADRAEYTASDQKFVLSGGQPTLVDDVSSDTTTGRSLTFFVANDTILIDSQEGSRTLTKHRVEK